MNNTFKFFKAKEKHTFHLVEQSQLPIITGLSVMLLVLSLVFYWHPSRSVSVHHMDIFVMHIAFIIFLTVLFSWFITIVRESGEGHHTKTVQNGLRYGMALFIVSEVMFFFAFFWGFFHFSLSPSIALGCVWPPKGIQPLDIWGLPLVNTLLLLSSGVTITLAHHAILKGGQFTFQYKFIQYLLVTIVLGIAFLICQGIEYKYGVTFSWKENVYGSSFFVTTGFHGFHVTVGTIFLLFCLIRAILTSTAWFTCSLYQKVLSPQTGLSVDTLQAYLAKHAFTKEQHFGFEAAAWYWHFVDVVWLFLFITVYWWGN